MEASKSPMVVDIDMARDIIDRKEKLISDAVRTINNLHTQLDRMKKAYLELAYQWSKDALSPSFDEQMVRHHILPEYRDQVLSDYRGWSEKARENLGRDCG